jgi:hypothetical protein
VEGEDEVVEVLVLVLLEEVVVLTEVAVLDGADSAVWVGLLANSPWDLSDKVIEGTAVEADLEDEVETVEVLALLEVVVLTVVCLASSPWDLSDTSNEGRGFEAENDGTMKTLTGFPSAPDLVAKGTITVVAVGLLVWEVTVLTGEALRDSALAS